MPATHEHIKMTKKINELSQNVTCLTQKGPQYCCYMKFQLRSFYLLQNRTFQQISLPCLTSGGKKNIRKMKVFPKGKEDWLWFGVFFSLFFFSLQSMNRKIKQTGSAHLQHSQFFPYLSLGEFVNSFSQSN